MPVGTGHAEMVLTSEARGCPQDGGKSLGLSSLDGGRASNIHCGCHPRGEEGNLDRRVDAASRSSWYLDGSKETEESLYGQISLGALNNPSLKIFSGALTSASLRGPPCLNLMIPSCRRHFGRPILQKRNMGPRQVEHLSWDEGSYL